MKTKLDTKSFIKKCSDYIKKMNLNEDGKHRFKPSNVHRHEDHLEVTMECKLCRKKCEVSVSDVIGGTNA